MSISPAPPVTPSDALNDTAGAVTTRARRERNTSRPMTRSATGVRPPTAGGSHPGASTLPVPSTYRDPTCASG
jgi:hypothetical protein